MLESDAPRYALPEVVAPLQDGQLLAPEVGGEKRGS